ncbi:MAG TPA: HlyD family efflux transporter periplasmic adaptor subunit [Hanamia sp.]|nr:HlyD family efflux transporter periplasmic adaptor subunit [Hanamia sp.]
MTEDQNIDGQEEMAKEVSENIAIKMFHQRSERAQEIISRPPGFIEKWALMLFLAILLLLISGTWLFRYPDLIEPSGTLTATNAPKEIISLQTGRLIKLFVKNGEEVKKGEMIGWIESTANANEVLDLSIKLDSVFSLLNQAKSERISSLFNVNYQNLGELQVPYQTFSTALQQYNDYLVNGFYLNKKKLLLKEVGTMKQMNVSIEDQESLSNLDEDSAKRSLAMNKILLNEKVISAEEYRVDNSMYLSKKMAIPQLNSDILNNQNQQRDKLTELEQLDHDIIQQKMIFEQALQTLKSNVDDWIHNYIMQAPLDGTMFFTLQLQQNDFIEAGKLLGYINPPDSKFYVEISLPQNNSGKVDTGMKAQLRFDAYPYQETGIVKGTVDYISPIATDSGFLATVRLENGLSTNLKKSIQYKNGLRAQVLIITKNMRLLQRMYYSVVKAASPGK